MNKTLLTNILLSAAVTLLVSSCATSSTGAASNTQSGLQKTAGDAAVDAATKNTNPVTGAAIRQTTGYGTDPVKKAQMDALNKLSL